MGGYKVRFFLLSEKFISTGITSERLEPTLV